MKEINLRIKIDQSPNNLEVIMIMLKFYTEITLMKLM
jgi:hypothetical protein